jgi:hypothetical protein
MFVLIGSPTVVVDLYTFRLVDPLGVGPSLRDHISQSHRLAGLHNETGFEAKKVVSLRRGVIRKGYLNPHTGRVGDVCVQQAAVHVETESFAECCDLGRVIAGSVGDWYVAYRSFYWVVPELKERV